jgi:hypothetical protein
MSVQSHFISLIAGGGGSANGEMLNDEAIKILNEMNGYTLMVHEFMYLLCNASDRVDQITQNHKVDYRSQKDEIHQWELQDRCGKGPTVSHIHLLSKNAFVNQAPRLLVIDALALKANNRSIKYVGGNPAKEIKGFYAKFKKLVKLNDENINGCKEKEIEREEGEMSRFLDDLK